ncbi:MAG: uroporphyrinogen-III synthase [Sulfurovum sp.]|nr:MAG: uroporphyrinogen-III synthase [Sulfurovum sp.]
MHTIYLCSPSCHEGVISLPMIEFRLIEQKIDVEGIDRLIFTSKEAVKSLDRLNKNWIKIPAVSIGEETTKAIKALGGKVIYSNSKSYGELMAKELVEKFPSYSFLYLRPKKISFDFKSYLRSFDVKCKELILYETVCKSYPKYFILEKNSVIIFTSPSTIKCFLKNFNWDSSYKAVVIGSTTQKHIPSHWTSFISSIPTIESCIKIAQDI